MNSLGIGGHPASLEAGALIVKTYEWWDTYIQMILSMVPILQEARAKDVAPNLFDYIIQ